MVRQLLLSLCCVASLLAARPAAAEYPDRPIRLILPFTPGGVVDVVARHIQTRVSELMGQQVVIDNRGGGGGVVATQALLAAPADGYTALVVTPNHTANAVLAPNLPYDTARDFASVSLVAEMPGVLAVNARLPVRTVAEFLDHARRNRLSYSSAGSGTFPHLTMELLLARSGVQMIHVPYRGAAQAMTDLVAGVVDAKMDVYATSIPHARAGTIRIIAVTSPTRIPQLPEVPALAEAGFPGYDVGFFIGVVVRANTPETIRARMEQAFVAAVNDEMRRDLETRGIRAVGGGSAELDALIRRELVQWGDLVRTNNLRPD
ncbi:Bug family tripartite tricarboxylate transporter substrate binding protein [Muricoccus radiodurans]|uniref:Bug family tripartite tricarboxylate transporter substrate binding protein n=1 Tax=Muricoccus radiodurans TaxID=2231721 RepID=UPI003CF4F83E